MDLALQQVSLAPDGPVAKEPQAAGDSGADSGGGIFSILLLLSLMGKNGGQDPMRIAFQGEDAGMRPGNLAEKFHEIMSKGGVLSASVTDLSQAAAADPNPSAPQISPHAVDTKGDVAVGLFTDQGKIAIPGLHGLESQTSPVFRDSSIVPAFLKDSDYQNNSGANSDPQGEYPWMGDANRVSVAKDPVSLSADSKLQSFQMHMDQENILQQLSARMAHVRETGTHSTRIRLKPDELGELSMDISVTNNSVKAFIIVENYHVKEIIEANLNRLEAELKNQGLSIEQFTVETGGGGFREGYVPSHDRGDSAVRGGPGRTAMDHSADQGHLMIPDPMGRGIVNLFV